jgi:hypothetical protein
MSQRMHVDEKEKAQKATGRFIPHRKNPCQLKPMM